MKNSGRMLVGDCQFFVTGAELKGVLAKTGFFWMLTVRATGEIEGDKVEAQALSERVMEPVRPVVRWQDVVANPVEWASAYEEDDRCYRGTMYLYSHEAIENSRMVFGASRGVEFDLDWSGETDSSAGYFDDYETIRFSIQTAVRFVGVETRDCPEGQELEGIRTHITGTDFRLGRDFGSGFKLFEPLA